MFEFEEDLVVIGFVLGGGVDDEVAAVVVVEGSGWPSFER